MRMIVPMLGLALLAGCQKAEQGGEEHSSATVAAVQTPSPDPSPEPTGEVSGARDVDEDTTLYAFEYSYPWAVGTIPALKARFDADIDRQRRELAAGAREDSDARAGADAPYQKHGRWIGWKVVTDMPGWLSLSAIVSTYEGGAHPNHWFDALLWDRSAGVERKAIDLFVGKEQLSSAIRADFCAAIDRQRARKRGAPVDRAGGAPFSECLDPLAYPLILGSSHGKAFDRFGILVPPYEAGPYAEGAYEVTLPVTARVLALVRPEFQASFVVGR